MEPLMTTYIILFTILGALLLGAMSPGPSFVLVSRISITNSRTAGLAAALGMGVGGLLFAVLALVGLVALLEQVEWLFITLKIAGGSYLLFLGVNIWRSAKKPLVISDDAKQTGQPVIRSFYLGFITQIANPKTAVVYASIFAALLPASPPLWLVLTLPLAVFIVEAGWYSIVAIMFSARKPQRAYLNGKVWFDRFAGAVLGYLGARLVVDNLR